MKKTLLIDQAHALIKAHTDASDILVDATLGNGHDTLFMSSIAKHVYAFDIQEKAIIESKKRLLNIDNVTLILDSHEHILNYVKNFKGVVFNLGYLPGSDKKTTTTKAVTLNTIKTIIDQMKPKSFLSIMVYIGHHEGKIESFALEDYLKTLNSTFEIMTTKMPYKENAPYHIFILK